VSLLEVSHAEQRSLIDVDYHTYDAYPVFRYWFFGEKSGKCTGPHQTQSGFIGAMVLIYTLS